MVRAVAVPLLLALAAAGCFSWRPWEPAAPLADGSDLPYTVRVFVGDSTPVHLTSPYVRRDSLFGRTDARDTVGFPVAEVTGFETERFQLWRTLGATVVAPAAAFIAVYAIVCSGDNCDPQTLQ
jgi:hypothetical protein